MNTTPSRALSAKSNGANAVDSAVEGAAGPLGENAWIAYLALFATLVAVVTSLLFHYVITPRSMGLQEMTTRVSIRTNPPGAEVKADGKVLGSAPLEVSLKGQVTLVAAAQGYDDRETVLTVSAPSQSVSLELKPHPARFTLDVQPPEARINVEGGIATLSDDGRRIEVAAPDGKSPFYVVVSHAGYEERREQVLALPGEERSLTLALKPMPAIVSVEITPPEAALTVKGGDAELQGIGARRKIVIPKPRGSTSLTISAECDGFKPFVRELHVSPGGREELAVSLAPLSRWKPVDSEGQSVTLIAIRFEANGTIVTCGPGVLSVTLGLGSDNRMQHHFDKPGSCWLMAEGGSHGNAYRGLSLIGGRIYRFDDQKRPVLTAQGDYCVQITFDREKSIYANKSSTGNPVATLAAGKTIQLLLPSGEGGDGWHKVRTDNGVEGWLLGEGWEKTTFMQKASPQEPGIQ